MTMNTQLTPFRLATDMDLKNNNADKESKTISSKVINRPFLRNVGNF